MAIDDLTEIISPIVTASSSADFDRSRANSIKQLDLCDVNSKAGMPVLLHFKEKWSQIHANSEQNEKLLIEVKECADKIEQYCRRRQKVIDSFLQIYENIDKLHDSANEIEQDFNRLWVGIEQAERLTLTLQNKVHEKELLDLESKYQLEYGEQTERLQREFEQFRLILQAEHEAKALKHETFLLDLNRKQREQFGAEFQADLEEYKKTGKLRPRKLSTKSKSTFIQKEIQIELAKSDNLLDLSHEIDLNDSSEEQEAEVKLEEIQVEPDESDRKALLEFLN